MNLYVCGPVTGIIDNNIKAFEEARAQLHAAGFEYVDIPHDFVPPGTRWDIAMSLSIGHMMERWNQSFFKRKGHGFGLAMLDGWNDSRGAVIEYTLAQQLNIPCKPWREWLDPAAGVASQPWFNLAC